MAGQSLPPLAVALDDASANLANLNDIASELLMRLQPILRVELEPKTTHGGAPHDSPPLPNSGVALRVRSISESAMNTGFLLRSIIDRLEV